MWHDSASLLKALARQVPLAPSPYPPPFVHLAGPACPGAAAGCTHGVARAGKRDAHTRPGRLVHGARPGSRTRRPCTPRSRPRLRLLRLGEPKSGPGRQRPCAGRPAARGRHGARGRGAAGALCHRPAPPFARTAPGLIQRPCRQRMPAWPTHVPSAIRARRLEAGEDAFFECVSALPFIRQGRV